jgi:hypothetical protein
MLNARAGRGSRARASAATARRWALRPARPQLPAGGARRGVWPWSGSVRCGRAAMRGGEVQAQGSTQAAACGAAFAAAVPLACRLLGNRAAAAHPRPAAAGRLQLHVTVLVCLATSSPIISSHLHSRAQPVRLAPWNVLAQRVAPTRAASSVHTVSHLRQSAPCLQCVPTQPPVADPAGCGWMAPSLLQAAGCGLRRWACSYHLLPGPAGAALARRGRSVPAAAICSPAYAMCAAAYPSLRSDSCPAAAQRAHAIRRTLGRRCDACDGRPPRAWC